MKLLEGDPDITGLLLLSIDRDIPNFTRFRPCMDNRAAIVKIVLSAGNTSKHKDRMQHIPNLTEPLEGIGGRSGF